MKSLILSLIFYSLIQAQSLNFLLMDDGVSYDADAQTYFDAMTTPLSSAYRDRINTFVLMVKDSLSLTNLSDGFDVMYLLANETEEAALLNLVKRSEDATKISTPTFTANQGIAGNGSTTGLNTNYNMSDDAVNFNANENNSIGAYIRNDAQNDGWLFGAYNSNYLILRPRSTSNNYHIYYLSGSEVTGAQTSSDGLFTITEVNTTGYFYNNSDVVNPNLSGGYNIIDANIFLCGYNNGGNLTGANTYQFSFFFIGGALTATEVRGLNNCIEWYMDDLGTGVQ